MNAQTFVFSLLLDILFRGISRLWAGPNLRVEDDVAASKKLKFQSIMIINDIANLHFESSIEQLLEHNNHEIW